MEAFYAIAPKVIFTLGLINLLSGFAVFFTCRCVGTAAIGKRLMEKAWYKGFYKHHCVIWRIFWPSVIVHATLAIIFFGIPV